MTTDPSSDVLEHERIWLQPRCCVDEGEGRQWCEDNVWPMDDCDAQGVEYVRAATIERLSAERMQLRDALREADSGVSSLAVLLANITGHKSIAAETYRERIRAALSNTAENG